MANHELSKRERMVLEAVIRTYVQTAEPAGSRTLSRRFGLGVSPATIRNTMSDLEEKGFLFHPHTSAGRVPTDKAYRCYVDGLLAQAVRRGELADGVEQQRLALEIVETYLGVLHESVAGPSLARIRDAGLDQVRFGWTGSLEPRRPHYYRLQGPTFLLEFDNSRNGGTHIHSVWRDFAEDFGQHLA